MGHLRMSQERRRRRAYALQRARPAAGQSAPPGRWRMPGAAGGSQGMNHVPPWLSCIEAVLRKQEHMEVQMRWRRVRESAPDPPRVVVIGAGFAGLSAVAELAHAGFRVTLIDHH